MGDFPVTETTPGSTLQDSGRVYQFPKAALSLLQYEAKYILRSHCSAMNFSLFVFS